MNNFFNLRNKMQVHIISCNYETYFMLAADKDSAVKIFKEKYVSAVSNSEVIFEGLCHPYNLVGKEVLVKGISRTKIPELTKKYAKHRVDKKGRLWINMLEFFEKADKEGTCCSTAF